MNGARFVCLVWQITESNAIIRIYINIYLIFGGEIQRRALQNSYKDLTNSFLNAVTHADVLQMSIQSVLRLLPCMDFPPMMGIMIMMDALVFIFVPERWQTAGSHTCRSWPLKTTSSCSTCKYPQVQKTPRPSLALIVSSSRCTTVCSFICWAVKS